MNRRKKIPQLFIWIVTRNIQCILYYTNSINNITKRETKEMSFFVYTFPVSAAESGAEWTTAFFHLLPWSVHCRTKALACCLHRSRFITFMYQFTLLQYSCSSSLHLFVDFLNFFCHHGCPNCQCCTPSIIRSVDAVNCPCPFYVFNYFHNVLNFSLVPHPFVSGCS